MALTTTFTHGRALPMVVLAAGVAISIGLGVSTRRSIEDSARQQFDAAAQMLARKVRDRFDGYTETLVGLRALFNTAEPISRERFADYVAGLAVSSHQPGFKVLNFAPQLPGDGHRIAFIEPLAGNEGLVGKDIAATPQQLDTLAQARDTGELMTSGRRIRIGKDEADFGLATRL